MNALPLITDPAFYAIGVPAVLLMGLSKSGFLSGFGSMATPLLALVVPVPQAAAIMLPLLLVMDALGLQQLWRERDRALLRLLMPAGLLGTVVGTVLFGVLAPKTVAGVVGALTLLFLAQRLAFPPPVERAATAALARPRAGGGVGIHEFRRACRQPADQCLRAAAAAAADRLSRPRWRCSSPA